MVASSHDRFTSFWRRLRTDRPPALDQGPRPGVLSVSEVGGAVAGVADEARLEPAGRRCLLATALLYHDHHNEAHDLVQDLTDADGALIHAILHRREPDFWNARYWFRRAGDHPAYRAAYEALPHPVEAETVEAKRRLTVTGTVDPNALVDACEHAYGRPSGDPLVVYLEAVQQAEFEALVAHLLA